MRNSDVVRAWWRGLPARGLHLVTDGDTIWSYTIPVGITHPRSGKICLLWSAAGLGHISQTTSRHVNMVRSCADIVVRVNEDYRRYVGRDASVDRREALMQRGRNFFRSLR